MIRRRALGIGALALVCACTAPDAVPDLDGPAVETLVRPDTPGNTLQFNFDMGDLVETFPSPGGRFLVHYTRVGTNAVPAADNDTSGVPDFVEYVADVYDNVVSFYETMLGFRAPLGDGAVADNGGDGRFDVYLVDFNGVGDGTFQIDSCTNANPEQCIGFMVQENDYAGYGYPSIAVANRILGSHEFFHAVQAAYDFGQGSVLAEGTAVWATEAFEPGLDDFEAFVDGYLDHTDRPIDEPLPGPVDPFSYGSAIVFQFFEEAYGPGMIRAIWEACENGGGGVADPAWIDVLDPTLGSVAGVTFADAFTELSKWNLYTASFADPTVAYARASAYPRVRIEDIALPFVDNELRVYHASAQYRGAAPAGRSAMTALLVPPEVTPTAADDLRILLATETGTSLDVIELDDVRAGTQTIDTSVASRLVVVVVNTRTGGDSKKPGLCVGTVDEVATCKQSLAAGGSGGAGGGNAVDEGEADAGCGCALDDRDGYGNGALGVGLALTLAQLRRRRKMTRASAVK